MEQLKTCSKCKAELPVTSFYKCSAKRDGLNSWCKSCSHESVAAYDTAHPEKKKSRYYANREKNKARSSAWYKDNREHARNYGRAYRASNPEKIKTKSAAWYKTNREKHRATAITWRINNPKKVRAMQAAYRSRNRLAISERNAIWYKADPAKFMARAKDWHNANREQVKKADRKRTALITDMVVRKYIARRMHGLKASDIPQTLIEAKRAHLKLARKIKEMTNG